MNYKDYKAQWPVSFLRQIESPGEGDGAKLWWLGGAGFALKTAASLVWIDPFFGPSPSEKAIRMIASPVDPRWIRRANAVFSSHDHEDHCEERTLLPVSENTPATFVGPRSSIAKMRAFGVPEDKARTVAVGDVVRVAKDLTARVLPCNDPQEPLAVSFLFEVENLNVYFGADGFFTEELRNIGLRWDIDVAILNFGRELYMSADEVIRCARALKPKTVIPMHWDIWKAYRGSPDELECLAAEEMPDLEVVTLSLGDKFRL